MKERRHLLETEEPRLPRGKEVRCARGWLRHFWMNWAPTPF